MEAKRKNFFFKGLSSIEVKVELDATLGVPALPFTTVKTWVADFKYGHMSTQNGKSSETSKPATIEEVRQKVHKSIMNDR